MNDGKKYVFRHLKKSKKETISVEKNKHLNYVFIITEGGKFTLKMVLAGEGASANIYGLVFADNSKNIEINTIQDHQKRSTLSDLHIKAVIKDDAFVGFEGIINMVKVAQQSNAYQRDDNLLLSEKARAVSKPALEIMANDVRCTHGATMGNIDEKQLYYLKSRGISSKLASKIIISGFVQEIVEKVDDEKIVKKIMSIIAKYL